MGWFSRSQPEAQPGRRATSRSSQATEAQVAELRGKARRRLIGALVLVLTAVIFVPMLFDSSPPQESLPVPVVVPTVPSAQGGDMQVASSAEATSAQSGTDAVQPSDIPMTLGQPETSDQAGSTPAQPTSSGSASQATASEAQQTGAASTTIAAPSPAPQPLAKPEPAAPRSPQRTDDGSVAIALLEGRAPQQTAAPSEKGNFILQIAAYGTDKDAQARREKLVASGVTNAYVEQAVLNGKPTFRLRVGPFPTREAAQAAQARLRALGYDNGFISTQ